MSGFYEVVAARDAGNKPNPHGGELTKWYVTLRNEAGQEMSRVYWQRKVGNEVNVGDKVYGSVTKGDYGPRFKMEQVPDGVSLTPPTPSAGPQAGGDTGVTPNPGNTPPKAADGGRELSKDDYWGRREERDLVAQQRMGRAHSQEMALRYVVACDAFDTTSAFLRDDFRAIIDWFANDLNSPQGNGEGVAVHSVEKGEGAAPSPTSLEQEVDRQVASGGLVEVTDEGESF
jgi:hypothetical protein